MKQKVESGKINENTPKTLSHMRRNRNLNPNLFKSNLAIKRVEDCLMHMRCLVITTCVRTRKFKVYNCLKKFLDEM